MSEDKAPPRPRQVTTTVVFAVVFDLVLLASLFDTLARLRTPGTRESLDGVLGQPPGNGLGVTTAQAIDTLRVLVFVCGALAAVALVFAVFVLQRHRAARVGYTVTAGLMLLTVPAAGLLPVFLALAAVPMWSRPARDWYAGRTPGPAGADARRLGVLTQGEPPPLYGPPPYSRGPYGQPPSGPPPSGPPPSGPYGEPPYPPPSSGQPQYVQPAYPLAGYGGHPGTFRDPDRRPVTVTIASVLTWIGAGATTALMLAFVAILAFAGDSFVRAFERTAQASNVALTGNQARALGWSVAAVFLVWSLAAIVLAVLAFRRSNAARIALVVSSVMAALLSLVGITSGLSAVTLLMAVATVVLLFTGGANQWYSQRRRGTPPTPGSWGTPSPQPSAYAPYQPPTERPKPW